MKQKLALLPRFSRRTTVLTALLIAAFTPAALYACGRVDLSITKSGPGTVQVGQTASYTLQITQLDTGRSTGTQTEVRDLVPAGFTFSGASGASCSVSGNNVVCTGIPNLSQNQSHTVTVNFTVTQAACANSPIQNTATVSAREADTNTGNNTSNTVTTTIQCDADLSITKSGPATVNGGGTVSYTVQVSNAGPSAATNVLVRDAIPSGLTFNAGASDSRCSVVGSNVECTASTLGSGNNTSFTIAFNVPDTTAMCGSTIRNTATVSSDTSDSSTGNNTSSQVSTTVNCSADLSMTKSGPSTVQGGSSISYTLTVRNNGPTTAHNVVVTDPRPANLTFNSGASSSECSLSGNNVVCSGFSLASGDQRQFTVVFDVPGSGAVCGSTIVNQASAASDTTDPSSGNNTSSQVNTTVNCQADLSITKTGPATIGRGSVISYTVTVTNAGPAAANGVTITDAIPSGLTFNSSQSSGSCVLNGSNILCNNITLNSGDSTNVTIAFNVPANATCGSNIRNQATVSSAVTDPVSSNNTSALTSTTVDCTNEQADLSITKTGPATIGRGGVLSYTVTVTNGGPATANGVTVTDAIPSGLTFNAGQSDGSCAVSGSNVVCGSFTLTNGQSRPVTIAFNVPANATCGSIIRNTATAATTSVDPNAGNNTSSQVSTTVDCTNEQADVSVTKTGPATIGRGTVIIYQVTATNAGPATANAVTITDAIPSGLTFNSAQSSGNCVVSGINVLCNSITLTSGQSQTVNIAFNVPANATCGSNIRNQATVSTSSVDPNSNNNQSQLTSTTVDCGNEQADVSIAKTGPATILPGSVISYTVTVTNNGPATANGVTVTDPIPSGLTFNAGQSDGSCVQNGSNILCNNITLTNGQSRPLTIAFNVPANATCGSTIVNQATVSTSSVDPVSGNNTSSQVSTTVDCANQADLRVTKTGPATITRGSVITYSVTATNGGPATAQSVVISDAIPSGLTFNAAGSDLSCAVSGSNVVCSGFNLGSGQSRTVAIAFNVPANATCGGTISNVATVASSTTDPVSSNNTSTTVSTTVDCTSENADVSISKTGPSTILRGATLTYSVTVTNAGPATANGVTISDPIPSGLTFNPAASDPSCVQNGSNILCNNIALASGQSRTVAIAFTVSTSAACGTVYLNRATVSTTTTDPNSGNNQSQQVSTTVNCPPAQADLEIVKMGRDRIPVTETMVYMIQVLNRGPDEAQDVIVTDPIPAGLVFNASQSHPSCQQVGNNVVCTGPALPASRQWALFIAFDLGPSVQCGSFIQNRATVSSTTADPNANNNTTPLVATFVECPNGKVSVQKTGPSTVQRGGNITYVITVTNTSNEVILNSLVFDQTPANTTFLPNLSTPGCFIGTGFTDVFCPAQNIPIGGSRVVTLVFRVENTAVCGSFIGNIADVWADNADATWSNEVVTQITCPPTETDLSVSKTGPATITRGNVISYQVTVTNSGPGAATGVQIADPIPSGLTFNSGASSSQCQVSGAEVLCSNISLASGASQTFTLAFNVTTSVACNATILNQARISISPQGDPNPGNNQSQVVSTTVNCPVEQADLRVSKTGPATITRGTTITYTITATNDGPNTATNVTVSDPIPTVPNESNQQIPLVFVPGSSDPNCVSNGTSILCNNFSLTNGQSRSFQVSFTVPATTQCSATIVNRASVSASSTDPNSGNNQSQQVSTTVNCPVVNADLRISKTGPATILRGNQISYTITATNDGPGTATNVVISDPIPSVQHETQNSPIPLQFSSAGSDPSCAVNGVNVLCNNFTLNSGQSKTVTIVFTVPSAARCSAFVVNQASVSSSATDPNSGNNQSQIVSTLVQCPVTEADLRISKVGQPTVLPGNRVSYDITVTNDGPATATNVTIADPIPTVANAQNQQIALTFDSVASDPSCAVNGSNVLCNNFSLTSGQSKTVTVAFTVPQTAKCNAAFTNRATVSASSTDPNSGNNQSQTVTTTVNCPVEEADLTIAKMGRDRIPISETLIYMLQAFNRGPADATNVTFTDPIPAGLIFNPAASDPSCQQIGNNVVCTRASLPDGMLWTIAIGFDINPQTVQCNSFVSNFARVSSDQTDPDTSTNTSTTVQTFVECPAGNLTIQKSGPATTSPGGLITYTILVTNNNSFTVQDAAIFDGTPANTTYLPEQSSPECFVAPGFTDVFCTPTNLAPGQQRTVTLTFRVNSNAPCNGLIGNIADVWSDNADPTWSNEVITQIICPTITFDISKTDNRSTVTAGEILNYQVSVTNTSTTNATNVQVVDTLPANVTFIGASDSGVFNGTQVNWNNLSINAGQTKVLMVTVSVNSTAQNGTLLTNTAYVVGGPTAIDQTTVVVQTTFDISKSDGRTTANAGETLIYTIPVTNTSTTNATNVTVTDTLPANVTFVSADNGGTHSNGTVTWSNLAFNAGQTRTFMVTVVINATTPGGTVLTNTARVVGGPTATDTTTVNGGTQFGCIDIVKETFDVNDQLITPVAQFTFQLDGGVQTTQNDSTGAARFQNVPAGTHTVTETVPPTWTQLSVTPQGGVVQVLAGPTCSTVNFKNKQQLGNPTFSITKTDNRTTVSPGETLVYTVSVTNTSTTNATNVAVTDTLPADVTFIAADNGGTHSSGVVTWTGLSINAGQTKTLAITVQVKTSAANGTVLTNTATVVGGPSATDTTTVVIIQTLGCIDVVKEAFDVNGNLISSVPQFTFQLDGGAQSAVNNSLGLARFQSIPTGTHTVSEIVPPTWRQLSITPPGGVITVTDGPTCSTVLFKNQQQITNADFFLTKTDGRTTAAPGETLTYTITVQNVSPVNATGVTVIDTLPANVTFVSATNGGVHAGGTVTWSNLSVGANSAITLTVTATVNSSAANGTVLTNSVSIPNKVTATDTTTVSTQLPTFTITKTDNRATAAPGEALTYVITVVNTSSFNATNVSVTDTLPSQVIYTSSSDNGSVNGQVVTWTGLSITAGGQKQLTVVGTINSSTANNTVLTNTAQVVNGPSATDTTTVSGGQATLTISKTDNRTTATPNETLTYVIVLQNTSGVNASNVSVTDTLPGQMTFVSATNGGTHSNGTVTWSNLSITANASLTLTLQAKVNSTAPDNTVLTNTVQIVNGLSATDTTTVQGGTPDPNNVTIDLTDDRDPVDAGQSFCYAIRVTNLNSGQLTNQTITQTLDGNTEFQSSSDSGSHSSRIITWRNITIPGNGTKTLNSCVRVSENVDLDELLTSRAFIGSQSDTETTRVGDEDDVDGNRFCEIQSITDTPDPVKPGETLNYSIRIRNGRSSTSTSTSTRNFDIVAFLDNDTTFLSASNGGDEGDGREVEWTDIRLRRGESESVRVTVRVKDTVRDENVRIRVQCEDDEEFESTRIEDGDLPPTDGNVRISIDKRASQQEAKPGDMVTYTLTLRNLTNREAKSVKIEDRFNAGSISIQDAGGGQVAGNGIDWDVGTLGPNDTRIYTYRVRVGPDMRHGQIISNTVIASSPDLDRPATDLEEVRILTELPQTGGFGFFNSFKDTAQNLRPTSRTVSIEAAESSATVQFIVWTSIISLGMVAGSVIGKRLFL